MSTTLDSALVATFFEVDRYSEINFRSSAIALDGDGRRFLVPGELTIKGVTRPGELDGVFRGGGLHPDGGERIALELSGELTSGRCSGSAVSSRWAWRCRRSGSRCCRRCSASGGGRSTSARSAPFRRVSS